ncbi:MAG: TonB-dependent receptor [Prevotellaceae bacterium]|jgi:outer membrane receptor protein involved in Fe transport|nr:TonB-dependent receptor [Prevotellaceae bacterium]
MKIKLLIFGDLSISLFVYVKCILATLGYALFALNLSAQATDTLADNSISLDEVVIQSFKYDGNFRTLPVAASTIDKVVLQNRNVSGIKDISSLIPNLFMPDYGSKLTSPVYIRGIGSRINSPSVGLYVDGIPFFEKSAFDFDLNEIDYIEVLRGPQGTLFGRNTMGGIINVYTKSPLRYNETLISASGGNYANLTGTMAHYGKINNTVGYALSGNYNHSGGYFTNQYTGKKADDLNSGSGRIRLEWRIKPRLLLKLMHTVDYSEQGGYPYAQVDPTTQKTGDVNYNDYSSYQRTMSSSGISLLYSANKFSVNSQTALQYLSDKQGIDQDFSTENTYFAIQNQKQLTVSQEINIKATTNSRYQWLFGTFAFHQKIDNEVILDYKAQNYSTQKLYDIPTSGISFYHQSVLNRLLIESLSLTLGIRYDYENASNYYIAYRNTGEQREQTEQTETFDSRLDFSQLTPKVALRYMFPGSHTVYVSASKGYKTGGFNSSFDSEEDRSFKPEYSWNYETGAKLQFPQNRIKAEICLFYIDWKSQQIYQTLSNGRGSMLKNAGRSESKGIELSLHGNIFKDFTLMSNWGYTHAIFKEYKQSATIDYSGQYLPLVPSQTFALGADYKIPVKSELIDLLTVNLHYTGTGKLYWNENNRTSQPYYGLLNGKIATSKGCTTLSIWAKNITNTQYTAFYFESMGNGFAQKGRPVTLGASVSVALD